MSRTRCQKLPASRAAGRPKKSSFEALLEDHLRDPDFRAAWEFTEPKRRVVSALLRLRAAANLSQKELAEKAGWSPAFISRLDSFPGQGERLYMLDLTTLESYARACGFELGLVFGRPQGRGARAAVAATTTFGDKAGFHRALAALAGCEVWAPGGDVPRIIPREKRQPRAGGRARQR